MKLTPQILAMYLGCDVFVPESGKKGILTSVSDYGYEIIMLDVRYSKDSDDYDVLNENNDITRVKPILRQLQDMTEEEAREFAKNEGWGEKLENIVVTDQALEFEQRLGITTQQCISWFSRLRPDAFAYLLSKGFDLFNLIPEGLAIDAKTLKS